MTRVKAQTEKTLDHITPDDLETFRLAATNANYFTDRYVRTPTSGTYWKRIPEPYDEEKALGWLTLYTAWQAAGKPSPLFIFQGQNGTTRFKIQFDANRDPVFHHHHGWLWMPWQLKAHHAPQPELTILGGMGCLGYESRIWDASFGSYRPIGKIYDDRSPFLTLTFTGDNWIFQEATAPFLKGYADLFRVTTKEKRTIICTLEHKFLTPNGYKPLQELPVDSYVNTKGWGTLLGVDQIESIEFIRRDAFYDLHVPIYENYLTEGVISHNSGKTAFESMSSIVMACTIPNFRGFAIAPKMLQSMEVYNYINTWCNGTPLFDRWLKSKSTKPYPKFVFQNDYIGESTIELYSIEKQPEKLLTLEGDAVFIDQAEQFDDLDRVNTALGTRLRGQVHGRPRLGKLVYIANSEENLELWYRYDMMELEPETYLSLNPTSYDNIFLTKTDIKNMERRVGGTQDAINQKMKGQRPIANGAHFTRAAIEMCLAPELDNIMDAEYEKPEQERNPEYVKRTADKVGIYHWELPPDRKRTYCVIADVGQSNPPDRNSPVIMVWDITDFPKKPAVMRAFHWVFAHGMYTPFTNEFQRMVERYRAKGLNGYDATGPSKAFNELQFAIEGLETENIDLSGSGKYHALNAAKLLMGKGLFKYPRISHLINQLSHYAMPDEKLKQDLVMCLAMSAKFLMRFYYMDIPEDEETVPERTAVGSDRHTRSSQDRRQRTR